MPGDRVTLQERFFVRRLVEADQQGLADSDGGRAQIARGTNSAATFSSVTSPPGKDETFFPLATITFDAALMSSAASRRPSLLEAGITSLASIPFASMNLDAFPQLVQPLRW